jgi:hypothetical protein
MRRRKLLVALTGLAVVVAVGVALLSPPLRSPVTEGNFERIVGRDWLFGPAQGDLERIMSREQVEAILGPPGDYTTRPTRYAAKDLQIPIVDPHLEPGWFSSQPPARELRTLAWRGDTLIIYVVFDSSDYVFDRYVMKNQPAYDGPLDVLVWRLKRQWHRWFPE